MMASRGRKSKLSLQMWSLVGRCSSEHPIPMHIWVAVIGFWFIYKEDMKAGVRGGDHGSKELDGSNRGEYDSKSLYGCMAFSKKSSKYCIKNKLQHETE